MSPLALSSCRETAPQRAGFAWWGPGEVLVAKGDLWLALCWPSGSTSPRSLMALISPLHITPGAIFAP